uniref:Kringle containing transmembrane protein 1 n=1 Tax=Xiphophorus couchianus TaxID=32473 RepID=A0A3B5LNT3_9TELE
PKEKLSICEFRVGACGGNYTSPAGVIYSPDFPDKYAASRVCYWTIQVPGSYAILLNFTFFDISDQTDMVELLDGYTREVVARFDWRSPPRGLVNITGDFVILYFFSDRTNQAHGFALLYQGKINEQPLLLHPVNLLHTKNLLLNKNVNCTEKNRIFTVYEICSVTE